MQPHIAVKIFSHIYKLREGVTFILCTNKLISTVIKMALLFKLIVNEKTNNNNKIVVIIVIEEIKL